MGRQKVVRKSPKMAKNGQKMVFFWSFFGHFLDPFFGQFEGHLDQIRVWKVVEKSEKMMFFRDFL